MPGESSGGTWSSEFNTERSRNFAKYLLGRIDSRRDGRQAVYVGIEREQDQAKGETKMRESFQ